jgi:hypothetical protein
MRAFAIRYFRIQNFIFIQIHFFAHLTMAKVISADSMFSLLQSFTAVLDEFGVSHSRAKKAALCAAEGLMIVCVLFATSASCKLTLDTGRSCAKTQPSD